METYKPNEFAKMLGVSVRTLQRWDNAGILPASRAPTGRRFYTHAQYENYMKTAESKGAAKNGLNCSAKE